jgi:hypothetical protein
MDSNILDAVAELHEMERQAMRVAGLLERASPQTARVFTDLRNRIRQARQIITSERQPVASAA